MHVHFDIGVLVFIDDILKCENGKFIKAPYRVYVDFEHCNGITKLIW
jgi:hypothetical protein